MMALPLFDILGHGGGGYSFRNGLEKNGTPPDIHIVLPQVATKLKLVAS